MINILTPDAAINDNAPEKYRGLDRYARAQDRAGRSRPSSACWSRRRPHKLQVPRGDRTGQVIEPYLTDQWFVKMDTLGARGLELVENGDVKFVPENWINTYRHWMDNIQDWCISAASSGGAIASRPGTTPTATSTSAATKPKCAQTNSLARTMSSAARTTTCWKPGSPRRCGRIPRSAGRTRSHGRTRLRPLPADVGAGHRLRHHLLLGRPDDHDDRPLHRPGAVQGRLHHRPGARQGRPEDVEVEGQRPRPDRHHRRHQRWTNWSPSAPPA